METLISHFSESIPNLGNEHKVTDGVLIGVGQQTFDLAGAAHNRLSYFFYLVFFSFRIGTPCEVISCFVHFVFENTCVGKEMFWFQLEMISFFLPSVSATSLPDCFSWLLLSRPNGGFSGVEKKNAALLPIRTSSCKTIEVIRHKISHLTSYFDCN